MVYISGALGMAALMEQNNFRLRLKNFRFFPVFSAAAIINMCYGGGFQR